MTGRSQKKVKKGLLMLATGYGQVVTKRQVVRQREDKNACGSLHVCLGRKLWSSVTISFWSNVIFSTSLSTKKQNKKCSYLRLSLIY